MDNFFGTQLKEFDYDAYWEGRDVALRSKLREREEIFFNWIPEGSRVLDVAAGNSALLSFLKNKKKCKVTAFDISPKVVKVQNDSGVDAKVVNLTDSEFGLDEQYDYIILSEILEHLPVPEVLLSKIRNSSRHFLISVPNSAFYRFRISLFFGGRFLKQWAYHPSEHLRFWSHKDFLDWFDALHFNVSRTEASNGLDIGPIKLFNVWPNLFGHQICYQVENNNNTAK